MTNKGLLKIGSTLSEHISDRDKYVSREFQKYGYELAEALGDMKHKSLYIKLAKETPRGLMETAKSFVLDAYNAKNKGSLFMWKLSQLKNQKVSTQEERRREPRTLTSKVGEKQALLMGKSPSQKEL